ncbi:hypothetical protein OS493_002293, partial [Desmophyllum pertusum]
MSEINQELCPYFRQYVRTKYTTSSQALLCQQSKVVNQSSSGERFGGNWKHLLVLQT